MKANHKPVVDERPLKRLTTIEILANITQYFLPLCLSADLQQPTAQNKVHGKTNTPNEDSGKPIIKAIKTIIKPTRIE